MKFYIKDFFSKCDQIRRNLRILKKSLMESVTFLRSAWTSNFNNDNAGCFCKGCGIWIFMVLLQRNFAEVCPSSK